MTYKKNPVKQKCAKNCHKSRGSQYRKSETRKIKQGSVVIRAEIDQL